MIKNGSMTPAFAMSVGSVTVATSNNGGLPVEYFAEQITNRLISVAEGAPEPIKAQALAYRDFMFAVVLNGIKSAIASDRAYHPR